jgi:hypothetical protein
MRQYVQSRLAPGVARRVEFTGELSAARVEQELRGCRFCVQPSRWENFSVGCCEAMAAGRTVVVGGGTGSVEVLGDAGPVIDLRSPACLAEAMGRLWDDRAALHDLSRKAYARVRALCAPAEIARRRAEFYQQVIAARPGGGWGDRTDRLAALPPALLVPLLPALSGLTGVLAGVYRPTHTPGARLLEIMSGLGGPAGRPAAVVLYGAGKHTARLLAQRDLWESRGHRVVGLIDDHPRFAAGATCLGLPVRSLAEAVERCRSGGDAHPAVVLSTDTYSDQFWAQTQPLRDRGVAVFRLY